MSARRIGGTIAAVLLAAGLAGCRGTASCKPGTLLLTVALDDGAEASSRVSVRVLAADDRVLSSGEVQRPAGQRQGTIEVAFAGGYPAGQPVIVRVSGHAGAATVASASIATRLAPGCSVLSIHLPDRAADAGAGADASDAATDRAAASDTADAPATEPDAGSADADAPVDPDAAIDPDAADAAIDPDAPEPPDADTDAIDATPVPDAPPAAVKRVFVTSSRHTGNLGGLAGAHGICQARARDASLTGSYRAWLSDSLTGPASYMVHSSVPYALVSGERVADSWNDLVDGSLDHAIDHDESGRAVDVQSSCPGGLVWTNTTTAGNPSNALVHCFSWGSTTGNASSGSLERKDMRWTDSDCSNPSCLTDLPLYCFEQ